MDSPIYIRAINSEKKNNYISVYTVHKRREINCFFYIFEWKMENAVNELFMLEFKKLINIFEYKLKQNFTLLQMLDIWRYT